MYNGLSKLDISMPKNDKVKFTERGGKSWISITPYDPQPEPMNISKLQHVLLIQKKLGHGIKI